MAADSPAAPQVHFDEVGAVPIDLQTVELAAPVARPAAASGVLVEGVLGLLDDQREDPLRQRNGFPAAKQQRFEEGLIIALVELRPVAVEQLLDASLRGHRGFARFASGRTFSRGCTMPSISTASFAKASAFSVLYSCRS